VISQDGSKSSAFALEYNLACDCWRFSVNQTDVAAPTVTTAAGPAGAALNVWTHLQGSYDSVNRTLQLYINGKSVKSATVPVALWNATGGVAIGRGKLNSANTAFFAGQIDDVKVWNRLTALSDAKAQFYPVAPVVSTASADVTVGVAFTLTLSSGGDTNVKKFRYYTSIADVRTINANANGTPVTVSVTLTDSDVAYVGAFAYYDDGTAAGAQSDAGRWDLHPHLQTSVAGTVIDGQTIAPVAGVTVTLQPSGKTTTTDSTGKYAFTGLTAGAYTISAASGTNRCGLFATTDLDLPEGATDVDLALGPQGDAFGYTCTIAAAPYLATTVSVPMESYQDNPEVELPFTLNYYGQDVTKIKLGSEGVAALNEGYYIGPPSNPQTIPDAHDANSLVAPLWGDFETDDYANLLHTAVVGTAPNRKFVVEWRDLYRMNNDDAHTKFSFEMVIGEDQSITFNYLNLPADRIAAGESVVGIESPGGLNGMLIQDNQPVVANGQAITFHYPDNPQPLGSWTLSGTVTRTDGTPDAQDPIHLETTGDFNSTENNGTYQFTGLETGDYQLRSSTYNDERCGDQALSEVHVDADSVVDLNQSRQVDGAGYHCRQDYYRPFTPATTTLALTGDNAYKSTALPFAFPFYGANYSTAWVDTNGVLYFTDPGASKPVAGSVPDPGGPNNLVAPMWMDLVVDSSSSVRTATIGKAPNRQFVVEWRDVHDPWNTDRRYSFEALLGEHGGVTFNYTSAGDYPIGSWDATIGIENQTGTAGYQYSYQDTEIFRGDTVLFDPPGTQNWTVSGTVRRADGTASAGAIVTIGKERGRPTTVADAGGHYSFTGLATNNYDLYVTEESRCGDVASAVNQHVEWPDTVDFTLARKKDSFGYACTVQKGTPFVHGTQQITMTRKDFEKLDLPFAFNFYGTSRTSVYYDPEGTVYGVLPSLRDPDDPDYWWFHTSTPIPTADQMNSLIVPFGRYFEQMPDSTMWTSVLGSGNQRQVVIEWRDVYLDGDGPAMSVEVILNEDGSMLFNYDNINAALVSQPGPAAGVENPDGTDGLSVSDYDDDLRDNEAILIRRV
jgi:hypothetical protein